MEELKKARKADRRNAYTEKVIRDTVFSLLQTKPIERISVTEVCRLAEINRSTFYIHYMDCMDVVEKEADRFCSGLIDYIDTHKNMESIDIIVKLHEMIHEDQDLYLLLIRGGDPMRSMKKFLDYAADFLAEKLQGSTSLTNEAVTWVAQYVISGSLSLSIRYAHEESLNMYRENLIHTFLDGGFNALAAAYPTRRK